MLSLQLLLMDVNIKMIKVILYGFLLIACNAADLRRFPDDFKFGVSTAAYQIEGAWNLDGKSESIWDRLVHTIPSAIADMSNGDVATDSYHNYKRDIEMLRELGVNLYRMSLSWTRILPKGFSNEVNQAGVDFYNNYINELLKYNITPLVTIYHWDLPQCLQDLGGFSSPLLADWFEGYARTVFEFFGDRVKHWITFNEPFLICFFGYGSDWQAPRLNITDIGTYQCAKNLVMAHARAYHAYYNDYKGSQGGVVGISIVMNWHSPLTDSEEDKFATELTKQAEWGLYADPIFSKEGGFPKDFAETVARKSAEQGYPRSRLPDFTDEERELARGTADFYGINHYTGWKISATKYQGVHPVPSYFDDVGTGWYMPEEWEKATLYLALTPKSLYHVMNQVSERYDSPIIYITENGWPTLPDAGLKDDQRIKYYRAAWESVLDALSDGIDVRGYMAWSLMDNFEWQQGYLERFGLYEVDFESPARTRTPRKSAFIYKELIKSRVVDHEYEPHTMDMWIDEGH